LLKAAPERLRGYYGAAKAAAASGDKAKAIAYYRKLDQLTKSTRLDRPELKETKLYLSAT
jgi:DNA-binding SARP family transcriptional activator